MDEIEKRKMLDRIAQYLMVQTGFNSTLGLFHGKMGCLLFLCAYARFSGKENYESLAFDLIDEIYEDIHSETPINLENGLCGIGWGIEYLVQHRYMEGDTGVILKNINSRIMEADPLYMTDHTLRKGVAGIAYYVMEHTLSPVAGMRTFSEEYMDRMAAALNKLSSNGDHHLFPKVVTFYQNREYARCIPRSYPLDFPDFIPESYLLISPDTNFSTCPLGLEIGLAGVGLQLLT